MRTKKTTTEESDDGNQEGPFPATAVVDGSKDGLTEKSRVSEWDNGPNYHDI